jgi:hypothetical protein
MIHKTDEMPAHQHLWIAELATVVLGCTARVNSSRSRADMMACAERPVPATVIQPTSVSVVCYSSVTGC